LGFGLCRAKKASVKKTKDASTKKKKSVKKAKEGEVEAAAPAVQEAAIPEDSFMATLDGDGDGDVTFDEFTAAAPTDVPATATSVTTKKKKTSVKKKQTEAPGKLGGAAFLEGAAEVEKAFEPSARRSSLRDGAHDFLAEIVAAPKEEAQVGKLGLAAWHDNLQPEPLDHSAAPQGFAAQPKQAAKLSKPAVKFNKAVKKAETKKESLAKSEGEQRLTQLADVGVPDLEKVKQQVVTAKKVEKGAKSQNDLRMEKEQAVLDKRAKEEKKIAKEQEKIAKARAAEERKQAQQMEKLNKAEAKKRAKEEKIQAEFEQAHSSLDDQIGFSGLKLKKTSNGYDTLARSSHKKGAHPMIQAHGGTGNTFMEDDE
jgi:hypothetical protein